MFYRDKFQRIPSGKLNVEFKEIQLDHLNDLVNSDNFSIDGVANVSASIRDIFGNPGIASNVDVKDIILMGRRMGDITADSHWNSANNSLNVNGVLMQEGKEILNLEGLYWPKKEKDKLEATLKVNELDLTILELTSAKGISEFGGMASGVLNVGGRFIEPDITGRLFLQDATVRIDYLNTTYTFSDEVTVEKDWMGIDYTEVYDEFGNVANVNGTVAHENFKNWNYDFSVEFDNLLCFDLDKGMNDQFYGIGFAEGEAFISGFNSEISIEVNAKSNRGTLISIPLGESGDVKLENFISFKSEAKEENNVVSNLSGLDLNLNIEMNRDAFVRLIFDEQIGDIMEGRGAGLITMDIDSRGEFNMRGNYIIEEGDYLFTLKNIVNKRFEVENGGSIRWTGDPYQAIIDIDAVYKVRASLSEFSSNNTDVVKRNVLTLCRMNLANNLLTPDINFEIDVPNISSGERGIVINEINSELELNRQFFSLIVLNKYLPSLSTSGSTGFSVVNAGVSTGVEFYGKSIEQLVVSNKFGC